MALLGAAVGLSPASAGMARDLCPDRPGKATPACTLDPGRFQYEVGVADWAMDRQPAGRTDRLTLGSALLRVGVTPSAEVQMGWSPYVRILSREFSGARAIHSGSDDLFLAVRQNIVHPDGKGAAVAVQPFVTLPIGNRDIGAGTWGAGLIVPASFELGKNLQLAVVPQIAALPDGDGDGRHLAYSAAASLSAPIGDGMGASIELWGQRDRDPSGSASQYTLDFSATWQPRHARNLQFDLAAYLGLNGAAPDIELLGGLAQRF